MGILNSIVINVSLFTASLLFGAFVVDLGKSTKTHKVPTLGELLIDLNPLSAISITVVKLLKKEQCPATKT